MEDDDEKKEIPQVQMLQHTAQVRSPCDDAVPEMQEMVLQEVRRGR